ncbi:serine/threonine protein kinase [Formosa agariphila KMM 3901]|uniref:Serine/threonine protein kinase n=1 Tax=Formosa agariphila (strain DSM 15362 / KCTC 12365 / LMG 23005 / KMM 3901 / M-2Alg 35-1) TaxID=1347342 RepID=T2KJL4_FORAG|nr:leucine-rich repeat-containing protein kinase family protein [Formosa agariphila]CDF79082.1 serine/threonine protein kinase [Formosa agariphila KMM 3901]
MLHTLEELKSGQLVGLKTLKLACGLKTFPAEILELADTLEVLDLSDNHLSSIPNSITELKKLRIIFFARNNFTAFPKGLAKCPELNMVGFKSNQITNVPENVFPPKLNWLILTDNKITTLPKSIGDCKWLQKCALAGNQITELPEEMANCKNLELLRISANNLKIIPQWLFNLPKLSWVAFGGNPGAHDIEIDTDLDSYAWQDFSIETLLGEGASGLISKAKWHSQQDDVAIKIFKGDVTSDGLPDDEMSASIAAGSHDSLIPILGKLKDHPEDKSGLIMSLIAPSYINLGNPPSMASCTRDVFDEDTTFNDNELLKIAKNIASVSAQLHARGINHGDLYAHNILVNDTADCLLGDFGAASFYDIYANDAHAIERVEVRAYGCLIEDLLNLVPETQMDSKKRTTWESLISDCFLPEVQWRPNFIEILEKLERF